MVTRRNMLQIGTAFVAVPSAFLGSSEALAQDADGIKIHYLEMVTPEVDAVCETYSQVHGVSFGDQDENLGNARTTALAGGGLLGVRAPLRVDEDPIVRHYMIVNDLAAAVNAAQSNGALVAIDSMALPGHGSIGIVIQAGIEIGYWQL